MLRIKLGCRIIEEQSRRKLGALLEQPKLGESQSDGDELLLAAGENLASRSALKT